MAIRARALYVCMYVCMYVSIYLSIYLYIYIYIFMGNDLFHSKKNLKFAFTNSVRMQFEAKV